MTVADETPRETLERLRTRLTVEQRRFCEEFANCGDPVEAYRIAYDADNPRAANRLIGRAMIEQYLAAMLECSPPEVLYTRGELSAHLMGIITHKDTRPADKIRAIEVAAKLGGHGVTTKHEITGKDGEPLPTSNGLSVRDIGRVRAVFLGIEPDTEESANS